MFIFLSVLLAVEVGQVQPVVGVLRARLEQLQKELKRPEQPATVKFNKVMNEFLQAATPKLEALSERVKEVEAMAHVTA